ncbi:hypothetical protein K474DRAFT_1663993 [Panus rudis PR-1116 ss-1]|nr:hypothetical protein K474DRAFT_1663993 [Panus rudis PR-1116 ss-1]
MSHSQRFPSSSSPDSFTPQWGVEDDALTGRNAQHQGFFEQYPGIAATAPESSRSAQAILGQSDDHNYLRTEVNSVMADPNQGSGSNASDGVGRASLGYFQNEYSSTYNTFFSEDVPDSEHVRASISHAGSPDTTSPYQSGPASVSPPALSPYSVDEIWPYSHLPLSSTSKPTVSDGSSVLGLDVRVRHTPFEYTTFDEDSPFVTDKWSVDGDTAMSSDTLHQHAWAKQRRSRHDPGGTTPQSGEPQTLKVSAYFSLFCRGNLMKVAAGA